MKITRSQLSQIIREALEEVENTCWDGYSPGAQTGVKTKKGKGGKRVANCEKVSEEAEANPEPKGSTPVMPLPDLLFGPAKDAPVSEGVTDPSGPYNPSHGPAIGPGLRGTTDKGYMGSREDRGGTHDITADVMHLGKWREYQEDHISMISNIIMEAPIMAGTEEGVDDYWHDIVKSALSIVRAKE